MNILKIQKKNIKTNQIFRLIIITNNKSTCIGKLLTINNQNKEVFINIFKLTYWIQLDRIKITKIILKLIEYFIFL